MPTSTARVGTEQPEQCVRRVIARLDGVTGTQLALDGRGTVEFAAGTCALVPSHGQLELIAAAADPGGLASVQQAIAGHLAGGTAQRELTLDWTPPAAGPDMEIIDPVAADYLLAHCTPPDDLLRQLVSATRAATGGAAGMQVMHDEGALLTMLTRLTGARLAVEVGVFTGYSTLCIARGLAPGGRLIACDVSEDWAAIGRPFWARAGVADRIDLRIGPALSTLRALPASQPVDIAFIDADKENYPTYYEEVVTRLRSGGLAVLDNVFLGGRVLDPACQEDHHVAMRRLNDLIAADDRVDAVMLPVRDGVTLARRR